MLDVNVKVGDSVCIKKCREDMKYNDSNGRVVGIRPDGSILVNPFLTGLDAKDKVLVLGKDDEYAVVSVVPYNVVVSIVGEISGVLAVDAEQAENIVDKLAAEDMIDWADGWIATDSYKACERQ